MAVSAASGLGCCEPGTPTLRCPPGHWHWHWPLRLRDRGHHPHHGVSRPRALQMSTLDGTPARPVSDSSTIVTLAAGQSTKSTPAWRLSLCEPILGPHSFVDSPPPQPAAQLLLLLLSIHHLLAAASCTCHATPTLADSCLTSHVPFATSRSPAVSLNRTEESLTARALARPADGCGLTRRQRSPCRRRRFTTASRSPDQPSPVASSTASRSGRRVLQVGAAMGNARCVMMLPDSG